MKMRLLFFFILFKCVSFFSFAQTPSSGVITLAGNLNTWYPVTFVDDGWNHDITSIVDIIRFNIHQDYDNITNPNALWKGSLVAKVTFHSVNYGHSSGFIDVDLKNYRNHPNGIYYPTGDFIAGWDQTSFGDADRKIVIWLKGNTTYNYKSNVTVSPTVYDGVSNSYPFTNAYGGPYNPKTSVESYVNIYGRNEQTAFFSLDRPNYFKGSVGIGTISTGTNKLAVEGTIAARRVLVTQAVPWPDYVFEPSYKLPTLDTVEAYVNSNKHLLDVPSASHIAKNGIDIGENQAALLKKVEELTLYIIALNNKYKSIQKKVDVQSAEIERLKRK